MPEISKKGQIWIVLVLRLALNLANALEPPCRFSAGNEALRWMNEDGSLRFPSYLNEDILGVEDEDTVLEDLADTTTEWSSGSFPCHFSEQTQELLCKDGIDFKYIKTLKNKQIRALIVDSYNKKERPGRRGCEMDTESLAKNPAVKVTAAIRLQDIHVKINTVLDVRKTAEDTFAIDGEIFSNKVIKIGWKYKGEAVSVNGQGNATAIEVAVVSSEYESTWRLNGSIEYANGTATFSGNISSTDDFSPAVPFGGSLEVNGTVKENMFVGTFEAKQVNVAGEISGRATKYMSKITIPSGAFSGINVRDMLFKNSHFFGDFHDRSFEGINQLETITFSKCRMDFMPEYDAIFGKSTLKALYIEGCNTPSLTMGATCNVNSLELISFRGSGFLEFSKNSFHWLRCSNLTYLNFHDTNFKIISNDAILEPVRTTLRYLDVSYSTLNHEFGLCRILTGTKITHLSLAGLQLKRVPTSALENVKDTLQYLSLRKNTFEKIPGENMLLPVLNFPKLRALRELDLQSCRINYVEKRSFDFLDSLEKLDLSRNNIINLKDGWVETKPSVMYLNLSYNGLASRAPTINLFDVNHQFDLGIFDRLETLDVSNSDFWSDKKLVLNESNNLRRLSLCKCRLHTLNQSMFQMMTKLTEIDLSGNPALGKTISFSQLNSMGNLQKLHLAHTGIVNLTLDDDGRMPNVQHLDLSNNYIKSVSPNFLRALPRLTVLDLSGNSISCWPKNLLVGAPMLQSIFMDRNKIETLKSTTTDAIVQLREISLGNNPFLCGCYVLDFVKRLRKTKSGFYLCPEFVKETETARVRANAGNHSVRLLTPDISGTRRLYLFEGACALVKDWDESEYQCYSPSAQTVLSFVYLNESFEECQAPLTEEYFDWTYLAVTAALLACFFVGFLWWKWWNIRIFSELLTAAAVLGFANDVGSDEVHYEYDAFVSYTDSDRPWVIEELIPNLEKLQNVKICLHERDFQVGISILENIVTCIDKSRCIILVVSQAFVSSQWCQYEMHLAYHRLLETKRDRMILIFLENIPRYKRPKTLRYLMMTKTYIQWPSEQADNGKSIQIFWNRLFRALLCDS